MKLSSSLFGFLCVVSLCNQASAVAQTPAATFEVASVKPNKSGELAVKVEFQPTAVRLVNMQLRPIIQLAYGITTLAKLAGVPDWAQTERFDIIGNAASIPTREVARLMLQALLADRFKLAAHMETRQTAVYALVRARRDGTFGPGLSRSTAICAGRGAPPPPEGAPPTVQCGARPRGLGNISFVSAPMAQLASMLSVVVGRPVVDRTGFAERYDMELKFTPETLPPGAEPTPLPEPTDGAPSLFTALQEQLGLKLEPSTDTVEVLVITHLERPTEN
jgi:uncharacterized protein (TIGR03435 family)